MIITIDTSHHGPVQPEGIVQSLFAKEMIEEGIGIDRMRLYLLPINAKR